MKVGLLVCGAFSEKIMEKYEGVYEDLFIKGLSGADPSLQFQSYHVFEDEFPQDNDECDAWLITGSKSGVYDNLDWMIRLQDFIRLLYKQETPLVGICFGHQIIAAALGGVVEKSDTGWGLGFQRYDVVGSISDLQVDKLDLYAIHQDQVVSLPPNARCFAKTDQCPNAALIYKGRVLSFQPHPEFSKQFQQDLIESIMGDSFSTDLGAKALEGMKDTKVHNQVVMKLIVSFMKNKSEITY